MGQLEDFEIFADGISKFAELLYGENCSQELLLSFRDALSSAQLRSKLLVLELAQKLDLPSDKCLFIGHWHGLLPYLFLKTHLCRVAIGVEQSQLWKDVSEHICMGLSWNSLLGDGTRLSSEFYREQSFDCLVNTSCEHMSFDWIIPVPQGTWVVAQANNYKIPEHTHIQQSLNDFKQNLSLSEIAAEIETDFGIYKRFTLVGRK